MVPTVNSFNKPALPLNFQNDVSSHLFYRKFCLIGNIFLLLILFLLKLKWAAIYPSLHLPRDKELGMSLIQFSVPFGPYLKSLVKLINCYAQFRPISSLEWTFLKNSSARLLWHLPQFWLATSLVCWTDGVNKKLSLGPLSARYLWGQSNKDIMDPSSKSPTTTTSAHWRSQSLNGGITLKVREEIILW